MLRIVVTYHNMFETVMTVNIGYVPTRLLYLWCRVTRFQHVPGKGINQII